MHFYPKIGNLICRICCRLKNNPKAGFFKSIPKMVVPLNNPIDTVVVVDSHFHAPVEGYRHYSGLAAETVTSSIVKISPSVLLNKQIAGLWLAGWLI